MYAKSIPFFIEFNRNIWVIFQEKLQNFLENV